MGQAAGKTRKTIEKLKKYWKNMGKHEKPMGKLLKIDQKNEKNSPNLSPFVGTKFQTFLLDI